MSISSKFKRIGGAGLAAVGTVGILAGCSSGGGPENVPPEHANPTPPWSSTQPNKTPTPKTTPSRPKPPQTNTEECSANPKTRPQGRLEQTIDKYNTTDFVMKALEEKYPNADIGRNSEHRYSWAVDNPEGKPDVELTIWCNSVIVLGNGQKLTIEHKIPDGAGPQAITDAVTRTLNEFHADDSEESPTESPSPSVTETPTESATPTPSPDSPSTP